jgi:NADH-quinone oxidoreductase subunit E
METDINHVREVIDHWNSKKDFLIEILQDIQEKNNYLPEEALREVSNLLEIPLNQIYESATYYKAFSLEPKGRFQVNICQGTACHVQGADIILKSLERELGIKIGETDKSMDFTLEGVRCIGCCGLAPVLTINQDVHAKFEPAKVPKLVEQYRKIPKSK